METLQKNRVLVIYHAPHCNDGFTAAWVTYNAMKDDFDVSLYPMTYGEEQIELLVEHLKNVQGKNYYSRIYVVDFSLPVAALERVCGITNAAITILDHHKTAFEMYGYNMDTFSTSSFYVSDIINSQVHIHLNSGRSGAGICWNYFHLVSADSRVPALVVHVQDRDLWEFRFEGTKEIHKYLRSLEHDLHDWDIVAKELDNPVTKQSIIAIGAKMLEEYDEEVRRIAKRAKPCELLGSPGLAVECHGEYASDVGNLLAKECGTFGLTFYENAAGNVLVCSLRSQKDSATDVEVLARMMGGGGHKNASGFTVTTETLLISFLEKIRIDHEGAGENANGA